MEMKKDIRFVLLSLLRFVALTTAFSAAIVMGTSHEKTNIFSISLEAKYSYSPALKYFVITNILVGIYSLALLFIPPKNSFWRFVIIPDMVVILFLTSSISAALAIGQVGKNGNPHAAWLPICGLLPNYCHQVSVALVVGFVSIILYLLLLSFSLYSLLYPLFV